MKLFEEKPTPPAKGYICPKWELSDVYRSTATAYMEREGESRVKNSNGYYYSLTELNKEINKYKVKTEK